MFGMMIDTDGYWSKILQGIIPMSPLHDLKVIFMWKFYVKNTLERKSAIQASCPVWWQVLFSLKTYM